MTTIRITTLIASAFVVLLANLGCDRQIHVPHGDSNISVPAGDPAFVPLSTSWIIDDASILSGEVVTYGDIKLNQLKEDHVAEVVILIQKGIKHPEKYATHYGRWLGLGNVGQSTGGGNNGLVWLIRPDAERKITISVGRGLPRFTSNDYRPIMEKAKKHFDSQEYNKGIMIMIDETDRILRYIYEARK